MRNIRKFVACAVAGGLLSLALPLSPVEASHVSCNASVSASTSLDLAVGPCTADGIIITGSNVTLDLAGWAVIGDENVLQQHCGIRFAAGVTGSSVVDTSMAKTGLVTGFNTGVCMTGGSSNTVAGIKIVGNLGVTGPVAAVSNVRGEGVLIEDSSGNTVRDSTIAGNGPYGNVHLLGNSDTNTIDNNVITGGAGPDWTPVANHGVRLEPGYPVYGTPDTNTISDNTVQANLIDGIGVFQNNVNNSSGVRLAGPTGNIIERNLTEDNRRNGIRLFGVPVPPAGTPHNCATSPVTTHPSHCLGSPDGNTINNNVVCANVGDGISVFSHDNNLDGNRSGIGLRAGGASAPPAPVGPCLPSGEANGDGRSDHYDAHGNCTENNWGPLNTSLRNSPLCIPGETLPV